MPKDRSPRTRSAPPRDAKSFHRDGRPARRGEERARTRPGAAARRVATPTAALARQDWHRLRPLLEQVVADPDSTLAMLREYAKLLLEWNRGVSNLVSRHDESRLVERHLRESLCAANAMKLAEIGHIVDYGSGAGLPAIPLAIAGVGSRWTLVESRRNKTLFMRKATEELGLKNISVMLARLEVAADSERMALMCDALTSRATAKLGPTLALASGLVRTGGLAYLWKGSSWESEVAPKVDGWDGLFERENSIEISDSPNVVLVFRRT